MVRAWIFFFQGKDFRALIYYKFENFKQTRLFSVCAWIDHIPVQDSPGWEKILYTFRAVAAEIAGRKFPEMTKQRIWKVKSLHRGRNCRNRYIWF